MAYQMLVGRHPFPVAALDEFLTQLLEKEVDLAPLAASAPTLAGVIGKLLARQPAQRYQQASEVITDLGAAVGYPVSTESYAIRESFLQAATFVGRQAEMAQLIQAL